MLVTFALTGIIGVILLLVCELIIRLKVIKGEYARKLVHIVIALYASTWAYFLDPTTIVLISLILVAVVIVAQRYPLLISMRAVRRITYGEIWFPLGIGISALMFTNPAVYAVAILHMGLADGLAAVVGVGMGRKAGNFTVMNGTKSIAGTVTFILVSFCIYMVYWIWLTDIALFNNNLIFASIVSLSAAIIVAMVELLSPKGSDNILVPITAGVFAVLPTIQLII